MTGIEHAITNQPFSVSCPVCGQECVLKIGRAHSSQSIFCDCGAKFDDIQLAQAANRAEARISRTLHDAGFR